MRFGIGVRRSRTTELMTLGFGPLMTTFLDTTSTNTVFHSLHQVGVQPGEFLSLKFRGSLMMQCLLKLTMEDMPVLNHG